MEEPATNALDYRSHFCKGPVACLGNLRTERRPVKLE